MTCGSAEGSADVAQTALLCGRGGRRLRQACEPGSAVREATGIDQLANRLRRVEDSGQHERLVALTLAMAKHA